MIRPANLICGVHMMKRSLVLTGLFLVSAACATSGGSSTTRPRSGSRDLIAAEELSQSPASNALDAIRQLRPHFLTGRGGTTTLGGGSGRMNEPVVYIDQQRVGGVRELSSITLSDIEEIRYLNGPDATQRFGTGHAAGAIVLKRRRAGR